MSDSVVETTIKLPISSEVQLGDLVNHPMIVTNEDSNGQVMHPAGGPTVLEMSCSAENATENSIDRQRYESRQKEYKEEEDGAVVNIKNYEETAQRSRVQTTDEAEVSSSSTVKFEEQEKVREKDGSAKVAEYNAKCEETHQTSVSTVEKIGDREFKRTRSSNKSVTRTCRRIEDMDSQNGEAITETSSSNETSQASGVEQGDSDDVLVKRSEKTTKSERSSTTISGSGDPSVFDKYEELLTSNKPGKPKGALIDLGALGEIKLSTQVTSGENTLERDFKKPEYFNPDLVGLDFGAAVSQSDKSEIVINGESKVIKEDSKAVQESATSLNNGVSEVKEHAQESASISSQKMSSSSSSRQQINSSSSRVSVESNRSEKQLGNLMAEENGHTGSTVHVGEEDDEPRSLPSSLGSRRRWTEDDDYQPHSLPPPFAPKNRRETDDLIKRILAEANIPSKAPTKRETEPVETSKMNGISTGSEPQSPIIAPQVSQIAPQAPHVEPQAPQVAPQTTQVAPQPPQIAPVKQKIKIDMGGEKEQYQSSSRASTSSSVSEVSSKMDESKSKYSEMTSETSSMQKSSSMQSESKIQSESSKAVGAERKRYTRDEEDGEMSLFERRLAKGVEKKLANIFAGDEGRAASVESDRSRSSYASERSRGSHAMTEHQSKYSVEQGAAGGFTRTEDYEEMHSKYLHKAPVSDYGGIQNKYIRKEKDEFDEIDDEINAWRTKYREQAQRRLNYMDESNDTSAVQRYHGRGRLVRQGYAEEDDHSFAMVPQRGPPPPDYIPDEEFEPKRRAETEEIVTERTAEIRTVVDKQSSVLEKLRSASNSFDELTSEIRNLKQQIIENSARRSFLMDDNYEDEYDDAPPPLPARPGRFSSYTSGSKSFDFSNYTPGSYSAFRSDRLAALDRDFSDNITSGDSLGLARYKKSSVTEEDFSYNSTKNNSRFVQKTTPHFGRSMSMFDDSGMDDDQKSEGDEFEEYRPKPRPLPSQADEEKYTPSVGPGYGSGHSAGDPDLGRSYKSRFTSSDDSSSRLSYTSRFSNGGASSVGYKSRLSRANTLSDFDFDRPSSQYDRSSSSSAFSSRFLNKVREKRASNTDGTEEAPKRDKPFKSRFLRQSFDSSDFVNKSSSYISRIRSSTSASESSSAAELSKTNESSDTSGDTAKPEE